MDCTFKFDFVFTFGIENNVDFVYNDFVDLDTGGRLLARGGTLDDEGGEGGLPFPRLGKGFKSKTWNPVILNLIVTQPSPTPPSPSPSLSSLSESP
jgi:hypothetical protein